MDINEYVDEIGRLFNDEMHGFRSEVFIIVSRIRAEARAEGLREAADRATTCFIRSMSESGIALGQDYAVLVIADKLRAAILDDKQEGTK